MMSLAALNVQEDRVKTYKDYETDLVAVLETGNLTGYSDACLRATVSLQFGCIFLRFTLAIANEHDAMTE